MLEDEQNRDARGEVIDTAPSGSNGPTGPVITTTTTPKTPKGDETLKTCSSDKSSSNKGDTIDKTGKTDKKSSGKPDKAPTPKKLAKGTKIPKHKDTVKPWLDKNSTSKG